MDSGQKFIHPQNSAGLLRLGHSGKNHDNSKRNLVLQAVRGIRAPLMFAGAYPANTKYLYNIFIMLDQRRRRWADVVQMLYKCFVFAG